MLCRNIQDYVITQYALSVADFKKLVRYYDGTTFFSWSRTASIYHKSDIAKFLLGTKRSKIRVYCNNWFYVYDTYTTITEPISKQKYNYFDVDEREPRDMYVYENLAGMLPIIKCTEKGELSCYAAYY